MRKTRLTLNHLVIGYRKGEPVFEPIDQGVSSGKLIALLGPNGIGKSTLLRTIAQLHKPLEGSITCLHEDGSDVDSPFCAFVPAQSPRVPNLSVEDMVSGGRYRFSNWLGVENPEGKTAIAQALQQSGVPHLAGRDSSNLSDGEFQRVAIARALVQQTPLMILDEPTAFLDIAHKRSCAQLLRALAEDDNKLILFSTHDLSLANQYAHLLWAMAPDGHFYSGTIKQMQDQGIIRQLEEGLSANNEPSKAQPHALLTRLS